MVLPQLRKLTCGVFLLCFIPVLLELRLIQRLDGDIRLQLEVGVDVVSSLGSLFSVVSLDVCNNGA